jgi:predicted exporter
VSRTRVAIGLWLLLVAACAFIVSRTTFTTDLSAFLPRSPTPAQQVLVDQLREGVVSRLMLIGIGGDNPETLARVSRELARELRQRSAFASIDNGDDLQSAADREFVWQHRYLLSPAVSPQRFSPDGLRERLQDNLRLLASPAGILLRRVLPRDPTGEIVGLADELVGNARPNTRHGVWFSKDGSRALLAARTRAPASNLDAQEEAVNLVRDAFARATAGTQATLVLTGPGVFSVSSRTGIKRDVVRFALIASCLIAVLLLLLLRSPRLLALSLVPVASGALAGIAAVSLGFGEVHGVTLGFGITLLGEGVDYAIYLFTRAMPGTAPYRTLDRIWPTLRLGVLTSICGFSAMLLSGFTGLAQLGLFSIAGLIVAAAVTRGVLPAMLPQGYSAKTATALIPFVTGMFRDARRFRYAAFAVIALAAGLLALERGPLWSDDLASLSPVARAEQELDQAMRRDLGAPDVRHLVVIRAGSEEAALEAAESVASDLRDAKRSGLIEDFESPSACFPSQRAQRERQAALPPASQLRENLRHALQGLPYRADVFEPFLQDVSAARNAPLISREMLEGTRLALRVDSLLVERAGEWAAMLPLSGVKDAAALERGIPKVPGAEVVLLDIKRESERLYAGYRDEVLTHSLLGAGAIVVLLLVSLRSVRRVLRVVAPLVASVIVVTAALALVHGPLSIFHLVGLLLVVAVGSNYSLFFDSELPTEADRERTEASLFFACASTIVGFGVLSFSSVPVLSAIGSTVGLGAVLALVFSAAMRNEVGRSSPEAS